MTLFLAGCGLGSVVVLRVRLDLVSVLHEMKSDMLVVLAS